MGSGLGLVSDKTHRVLSSLVGETLSFLGFGPFCQCDYSSSSPVLWSMRVGLCREISPMCITTIIAITMNIILPVCFAGVSHGAMLSWPAEVLSQVRKFKSPPEMRVLKHDLDVMGIMAKALPGLQELGTHVHTLETQGQPKDIQAPACVPRFWLLLFRFLGILRLPLGR